MCWALAVKSAQNLHLSLHVIGPCGRRGSKPYTDENMETSLPSNFPKFSHLGEPGLKCKLTDTKSSDKRQSCCVCRRGVNER